jgi:hypothetical protein
MIAQVSRRPKTSSHVSSLESNKQITAWLECSQDGSVGNLCPGRTEEPRGGVCRKGTEDQDIRNGKVAKADLEIQAQGQHMSFFVLF